VTARTCWCSNWHFCLWRAHSFGSGAMKSFAECRALFTAGCTLIVLRFTCVPCFASPQSVLNQQCFQEWGTHYQTDPRGNACKAIFPALLRSSLPLHSLSLILFRLCTGHCQLNHHLSRIGLHPDGLCAHCETPETVDHVIEVRPKYLTARNRLKLALNQLGIPFHTPEILRCTAAAKLVETFVRESNVCL